ncbi:hypothetical protein WJX79_003970 [Trebouxia sp. C0005]
MGVVALNNAKRLRPVERDVQLLLAHFTQAVEQGSAPTFSTFKKVWTQRHFSWIYLGNSTSLTTDHYVQSLYAMALDCLDVPIPEMPILETASIPTSPQAQPEPGARLMAAVANRPPQPPGAPCRDMYSLDTSHQSQPNPTEVSLATKVGSIFAIYCIYETQPGRTPIYLPLELLQQLLDLAQECHAKGVHDVMRVLRQLMAKRAFVVGAVRRPPSRSAAAEAACNAPSRLAASSLSGAHSKAQKERDCVYHVQCMYRGLGIVGTLGPMCRAYKAAKQQACEKAGVQHAPKGIANLTVGAKLPQLLWNATKKMQLLIAQKNLRGPRRKRKKPGRGVKAALRQADERRQRKEQAVRSWRAFEGNVLNGQRCDTRAPQDHVAAQQPQPGPAPMDWADVDHSIPAPDRDHAADIAGQGNSNGAQAHTQAAPSNGTALPRRVIASSQPPRGGLKARAAFLQVLESKVTPEGEHQVPVAAQCPAAIGLQLRQVAVRAVVQPDIGSERDPLADESQLPLSGKRIMITAPRQYAHKLAAYLIMAGARPVWVPSISITHIRQKDKSKFDEQMQNLSQYDHIAFTSRNGIHAVMQRLEELQGSPQAALQALSDGKVQCWALGADAQLLRAYGVQSVQTPAEASTQGLVTELRKQGRAQGARVLCPVPLVTEGLVEPPVVPRFLEALQAAGAEAVRLDVYQTAPGSNQAACAVERQLLRSGGIHAIAFSSTAEAQGLTQIMNAVACSQRLNERHTRVLASPGNSCDFSCWCTSNAWSQAISELTGEEPCPLRQYHGP